MAPQTRLDACIWQVESYPHSSLKPRSYETPPQDYRILKFRSLPPLQRRIPCTERRGEGVKATSQCRCSEQMDRSLQRGTCLEELRVRPTRDKTHVFTCRRSRTSPACRAGESGLARDKWPNEQILCPYSSYSGAKVEQKRHLVPSCTAPSGSGVAVGCGSYHTVKEDGQRRNQVCTIPQPSAQALWGLSCEKGTGVGSGGECAPRRGTDPISFNTKTPAWAREAAPLFHWQVSQ